VSARRARSHVTEPHLRAVLARAAPPAQPLRVIESRGAAADHPTLPGLCRGPLLEAPARSRLTLQQNGAS